MHAVTGGRTACSFGRYVDYFRRVVPDMTFPGEDAGNYWSACSDHTDRRFDRLTAPPAG